MICLSDMALTRENFIQYWMKNGFVRIEPFSVIPPDDWSSTIFVNSGLIRYLEIVKKQGGLSQSLVGCQPCIKLGFAKLPLEEMLEKDGYFTFFEQLTCGGGERVPISWFIERVWRYLTTIVNLPPEIIRIGVYSSQPEIKQYWIEAGVETENIVFPDPEAFILELKENDIQGIYSSIYYDRQIEHPLSCGKANCNINCPCGRFLELGDVGIIYSDGIRIIDHGIGLERITAMQAGLTRVTDIELFSEILSVLSEELAIGSSQLVIADHVRSSVILLASGLEPSNKSRGYALRSLLRRTFGLFFKTGCFQKERVENIYLGTSTVLNRYIPYLEIKNDVVVHKVLGELKKYNELLGRATKVVERFLKKRGEKGRFSDEEIRFLYETHGVSRDILKNLAERFI